MKSKSNVRRFKKWRCAHDDIYRFRRWLKTTAKMAAQCYLLHRSIAGMFGRGPCDLYLAQPPQTTGSSMRLEAMELAVERNSMPI